MKITRFEDLECWKEARVLTKFIYEITDKNNFNKDYRLRDQIVGAGISIMNNIAEGFDSQSNNEFIRFLQFSRRALQQKSKPVFISL